ncbi:helix-turn-helix domain-containing protein [Spirosoma gilvum]
MKQQQDTYHFSSLSALFRFFELPAPSHPMIALVDYSQTTLKEFDEDVRILLDVYKISFKDTFSGSIRYGQGHYDFEEGGLAFLQPNQLVTHSKGNHSQEGYALYVHPDFIRNYPLGTSINDYGFFSYAVSEALYLSLEEKIIVRTIFQFLAGELNRSIDAYSQDVLVNQLQLLLTYSNRFYYRQFITRKTVHHELIVSLDQLLKAYFDNESGLQTGLPSVQYISQQLNCSQRYLSDMLRSLTGMNTQQYIQNKLIEKAKEKLSTTHLSVSEIAYQLGFEHPQSFSKLFKIRTKQSPLAFRQRFN